MDTPEEVGDEDLKEGFAIEGEEEIEDEDLLPVPEDESLDEEKKKEDESEDDDLQKYLDDNLYEPDDLRY